MANIFISYAREDRQIVKSLADIFLSSGHTVWWDKQLTAGFEFREEIKNALEKADLILVVWSERSVLSRWVLDEADFAARHGKLMPLKVDQPELPLGFAGFHAISINQWDRQPDHSIVGEVLKEISARLGESRAITKRPPIRYFYKSLVVGAVLGVFLSLLLSSSQFAREGNIPDVASVIATSGIALVFGIILGVWSGFEVSKYGIISWPLIWRRAIRLYAFALIPAFVLVAIAAGLGATEGDTAQARIGELTAVALLCSFALAFLLIVGRAVLRLRSS